MALKSKISSAVPSSSDHSKKKVNPDKYRLLVTAGPSYDVSTHRMVHVNTSKATYIENDFIRAKVKVRIRGYRGLPSDSPSSSPYFSDPMHVKDQYSVAFSFIPKQDLPSKDLVWGNDFDHPVRDRLPPGVNTAFKIVKDWVDPGLEMDAYADEPWLLGPALSCWFALRIGDKVNEDRGEEQIPEAEEEQDVLREGADGEGVEIRKKLNLPDNNEKRRKHFLNRTNREAFTFEKGRLYHADFYNPYLDFGNFALKLPGFSIKVIKYIDNKSHTLRYVFKNKATGDVYLCVNMNLLWGNKLKKAVSEDAGTLEDMAGGDFPAKGSDVSSEEDVSEAPSSDSETHPTSQENGSDEVSARPSDVPEENTTSRGSDANTVASHVVANGASERDGSDVEQGHDLGPDEPGMADKPDHIRQQVQQKSITDLLQQSSTADGRGTSGGRVVDDDVD